MKTNPRKTSEDPADVVTCDDIAVRLGRAQSLAEVLADAAGGGLGVEDENVLTVGLVIADELKQAQELLARYHTGTAKQPRKAKGAA